MKTPEALIGLFNKTFGADPASVASLGAHASKRSIYRLGTGTTSYIGVLNDNHNQNQAFLGFSKYFLSQGLPVPKIIAEDLSHGCYIEEDLGESTLLDVLHRMRRGSKVIPDAVLRLYQDAVRWLPEFQIRAGRTLDYSLCSQRNSYDRSNMLWDMNFFRDSFIRELGVTFDTGKLANDFEQLATFLSRAEHDFFMYRDFQARNIMVRDGKLFFIDYQEGRKGPLQYDLVSLLYQSKADLPPEIRKTLFNTYLEAASRYITIDRERFLNLYHGFIFIRLMQVLGTYGEQGLKGKKEYFKQSIPLAINNLGHLLDNVSLPVELPELNRIFRELATSNKKVAQMGTKLTVNIYSFSYKQGVPPPETDHGGGFIFDCRCIPNPGREEKYKSLTGLDQSVKEFLDAKSESDQFFDPVSKLIDQAIQSYIVRGFNSLSVAFGCTGGQHRSVYFAKRLADKLSKEITLAIELRHYGLEELARNEGERA